MRERPILLNSEMVKAVLDGRKTQTRRIVKCVPSTHDFHGWVMSSTSAKDEGKACWAIGKSPLLNQPIRVRCPFGDVGDRLWVRESFYEHGHWEDGGYDPEDSYFVSDKRVLYAADGIQRPPERNREDFWSSRPSIHMPRWASRITLEITGVRVERLQNISGEDARSEGFAYENSHVIGDIDEFSRVWTSIYGAESWQANPWCWVIEFKRIGGAS